MVTEKPYHLISPPPRLNSGDTWHWRRGWGFSEGFQIANKQPDNINPFLHSCLFPGFHQHETHLAITFHCSRISVVWAVYSLHWVFCRKISYSMLQVMKTSAAPWHTPPPKTPKINQKTHLSSFRTTQNSDRLKFKHHLYQGTKLYSNNHSMSQEFASTTLPQHLKAHESQHLAKKTTQAS